MAVTGITYAGEVLGVTLGAADKLGAEERVGKRLGAEETLGAEEIVGELLGKLLLDPL